ncbi:hypothetical protein SY83_04810 [Paenibacillus swuensis]|uniref:Uncharacterized protein n=1 Tax=Paenibacillus swuensis TaxID=1178515 RepID=A0A172TFJ8_9BACL|nr:hypothetical protein [Paenibacillus swuensis]ANE45732.1 hypothetical protein SY83_04810 [Paenibacillus swuensis]
MDHLKQAWVNDYLDLYNFAGSIGDTVWQHSLLEKLNHADSILLEVRVSQVLAALQESYARINQQMLELFQDMKQPKSVDHGRQLQEQWLALKVQRVNVGKKLAQYK